MSHHEEEKNQEEAKETDEAPGRPKTSELSDEDLEEVAGGDEATQVHCGIVD